ncbi:MAG: hybrid sensor histidine kinase/response regulator [Nitrospirae bacterium]|nr:hybrid sensor histidine kinase/response regulator [Nitrospirota bacterium]
MLDKVKEKAKILVVEDSSTQAVLLRRMLEGHKYDVITADNGLNGCTKVKEHMPSLIISDVNMPVMNGYEMCETIKQTEELKHIPIILLTGLCNPEDIIYGLACGADNFIIKPYTEESLLSRIDYLLATSRIRKSDGGGVGIELRVGAKTYMINSEKRQILNLLVSAYEKTIEQNRQLKEKEQELTVLNADLERRISEETLKGLEKEQLLIQQSKMAEVGSMINAIAHQWRQPLNVISLMAQEIEESYKFGDLNKDYLMEAKDTILTHVDFMTKTVDDFCRYLRPSKEKIIFDIKKSIEEVVLMFSPYFQKSGISLNFDFIDENVSARGYPNEFKQVILNLINNARDAILLKCRETGQPAEGRIDIGIAMKNKTIKIRVSDNGGGIPSDIIGRIFEPYFTTKESHKGTGIGLYMSKTIIEKNMGWKLNVANVEGGAEFVIEI